MEIFVATASVNLDSAFDRQAVKNANRESRNRRSRETLVYIKPSDFLKLAEQVRSHDSTKHETVKGLLDRGEAFDSLPYLKTDLIKGSEFKVMGHEGRHRSLYLLKKYPNRLLPVRLIDSTMRWGEDGLSGSEIKLEAQDSRFKLKILIP